MRTDDQLDGVAWEDFTPEEQERARRLLMAWHSARLGEMIAKMIKPRDLLRGVY